MEEKLSTLCDRFAEERQRLGLTQTEVAKACGVSREIIGRYERGKSVPGGELLFSFSEIGGDVNYILTGHRCSAASDDQIMSVMICLQVLEDSFRQAGVTKFTAADYRKMAMGMEYSATKEGISILKDGEELVEKMARVLARMHTEAAKTDGDQ